MVNRMNIPFGKPALLAASSVLALGIALPQTVSAQSCATPAGLPQGCNAPDRGDVVVMPAGENTKPASVGPVADGVGFSISIDGETVAGDRQIAKTARRVDVALSQADVQVKFDGLGARPRLDIELQGADGRAGQIVTVQSRMNYPAYVTRGELRIIDREKGRVVQTVPIDPNGQARFTLPQGDALQVVHRVYDARGRYDETAPVSLMRPDTRDGLSEAEFTEEGSDATRRRAIPVNGGAVTVYGTGLRQGAVVHTLGERVAPDASGGFVLQRILPAGDHAVDVRVSGAGENVHLTRDINIPKSDWFYVATADLTWGKRFPKGEPSYTYDKGRLAFYAKGKTATGWTITGSADTGEAELSELFRDFDKKDPRHLLLRLDDDRAYPVYGDDSVLEEDAPTSGKFYLKAEKSGNHLLWGNYKSTLQGGEYLRNERTLYGFQGVYHSQQQTNHGEARLSLQAYAAQPDNLPGRDIFRGTGGTVYFLQRQDLSIGSETISIEIRDPDTGRVIERRALQYGRDYTINYIQGLVILSTPLSGSTGGGTVISNPGGDYDVRLVAQYEYTPAAGDLDGYSYGGRVETWATDRLRFGATGMVEQTGDADQEAWGVDLRYRHSENTYLDLEYAESRGPGFSSSISDDGGLIITNNGANAGAGKAYLLRGQADLQELGLASEGTLSGYWEKRTAGFSSLDYNVTDTEELWGVALDAQLSERLSYKLYYDAFENAAGKRVNEGGAELRYVASERVTWDFGVEHVDKITPTDATETGKRTDVAAKLTLTPNENLSWYLFGQKTIDRKGGLSRNDRYGAGVKLRFSEHWSAEAELSDGSKGLAGRALINYASDAHNSTYFGYELDPDRTLSGVTLAGRDQGQFVAGGKRRLGENTDFFAENTYDIFGRHRSLTSTYGINYAPTERLRYSISYEMGRIDDDSGDFDRSALSLGVAYQDGDRLNARARLELRRDRGVISGTNRDADTYAFLAKARYKINEEQRLLFSLEATNTENTNASALSGDYIEATLGYAYRPINDDRLNLLLKYTYLYDMYGQEVDGTNTPGPVQESHVFSVDATYDLNQQWTLGGKVGVRLSESAPNPSTPLARNDAWLGVVNLRYHVTHNWDMLLEARHFEAEQAGLSETSVLGAAYRHIGNNMKLGIGYNFGSFSDDLTDLTHDDKGVFINLIAKF